MFADSGAKPPPGLGTSTPEQVAAGVVRAIERDKMEVAVAPLRSGRSPTSGSPARRVALRDGHRRERASEDPRTAVAEGQANKR